MIKIGIRHNLIFPIILIICEFARAIELDLLKKIYEFKNSFLFTIIMYFSEMIFGLIIFLNQKKLFKKKKKKQTENYKGIELITTEANDSDIPIHDSRLKNNFIIVLISFLDCMHFSFQTFFFPELLDNISKSLLIRLTGIITLFSAILYYLLLKAAIYKHQKYCLAIIGFCLIIILITEPLIQDGFLDYIKALMLIIYIHFSHALIATLEKYLIEINYIDPFQMLMIEGVYGIIISSVILFILFLANHNDNPFNEIKLLIKRDNFIIILLCLFIFFLLSGGKNSYKEATNKIFSPMTISLSYCIVNPLLIIYYFLLERGFIIKGYTKNMKDMDLIHLIINLVISLVIVFIGCIYNEALILFCCGCEHDTFIEIRRRGINDTILDYSLNDENDAFD
jgi:drug/metabolite transporter (DMT)-like permease